MDAFTRDDLELLTGERTGICVSLYLRTHTAGSETLRDPISFNNMLARAEEELAALGMRPTDARRFMEPARRLGSDKAFWQFQGQGLALFLTDGLFRSYRLPIYVNDLLVVTGRFHLKPLLTLLGENLDYYLLALSRSKVRLFQGRRFGLREVTVPGVPAGMEETLSQDRIEAYQQYHVRAGRGAGGETAMFYGRGEGRDDVNDQISRYFHQVNEAVHDFLRDKNSPLVLAGIEHLLPLYRQANTYPGLLPGGITVNSDALQAGELQEKAWPLVEPLVSRRRREALEEVQTLMGTGKASTFMPEIVPASYQGRVSTLLVSGSRQEWGTVDRSKAGVVSYVCKGREQGCEDLYDFAAVQTLLKGGKVFVVEEDAVTDGAPMAAVFRY
jgi:hypothetical protein